MSKTPTHLTYVHPSRAQTIPGIGFNAAGRVVVFGDVIELKPEFVAYVGEQWVAERLEGGAWLPGTLEDNPTIKERRESQDAAERARFEHYQRTGL